MEKKEKLSKDEALKTITRLIKDVKPIAGWLILATAICVLSIILLLIAPSILGNLTDTIYAVIKDNVPLEVASFIRTAIILAAIYGASAVLSILTTAIMNYSVTRHFTCRMRTAMSEKIAKIPVKTVDSTPNGEIISRMTHDVGIMGNSIHNVFSIIINGAIQLVMITVMIFIENWLLACAVVIFVPFSMLLSCMLASKSRKYFDKSRTIDGKIYALCEENLTGFDTVKVFGLEIKQNARYDALTADNVKASRKGYAVSGMVSPVVGFVNNFAYIAICVIGGYLAIKGTVSTGDLLAFIMYTKMFAGPLESLANGMSTMQSTIASAKRVYAYLDSEEMEELPLDANFDANAVKGNVEFNDVNFSYTKDKPLIEGLNLDIKQGQKIAIVGPTGGGKTTIVNLLMRFYDPQAGAICVDGRDLSTLNRSQVRNMFSMVLQDTILFSGTIYENIAYGKPDATQEEVETAAKKAHIDTFIDTLSDGYKTVINEDSTNISGGQKQLLTIARAYLADRPILILDEATSNVDTRTEILIQQTMDDLMKGRTSFVIAHRLSTIIDADMILVINNGTVVERGTHEQLLAQNGLYHKLYTSQHVIA